jgi:ribosomal protein S18 acetylase RimI-like enzyme
MSSFRYVLSSHSQEEKEASLNLVRESFGSEVDIAYDEYYEWQYLKNPLGKGNVLLAYDGEKAVAQIATAPCAYKIGSEYVTASSIMNLSVSSQYRGKGIMGELVSRIHNANQSFFSIVVPNAEAINGYLKKGFYPMPMAFMIRPVRLSNYFHNRQVAKVLLKPLDPIWRKKKTSSMIVIQEHKSLFDERFDDLFIATYDQSMIRQIRDTKFLNWRYKVNPRRKYITFTATSEDGKIQGYIIVRIMEIFDKRSGIIVDLLTRKNSDVAKSLIISALDYFWKSRVAVAMAACFPNSREYASLKKGGFFLCPKRFRPHPLTLCLKPASEEESKTGILTQTVNWFFMLGDYETF